jgi:hypothetical protein
MNPRVKSGVFALLATAALACNDAASPGGEVPAGPEAPLPPLATARALTRPETARLLARTAGATAARGDSLALRELRTLESAGATPAPVPMSQIGEYEESWGYARIWNPTVLASLDPAGSFAYASMSHDGHFGEIDLRFTLSQEGRGVIMNYGPARTTDFNPLGRYNQATTFNSAQVVPASDCDHHLTASAEFRSYYVVYPLPSRFGPFTFPQGRTGETRAGGATNADQTSCASGGSGSGGGADEGSGASGGGHYVVYSECRGDDYYVGGVYVFSVVEYCTSYALFVNAE